MVIATPCRRAAGRCRKRYFGGGPTCRRMMLSALAAPNHRHALLARNLPWPGLRPNSVDASHRHGRPFVARSCGQLQRVGMARVQCRRCAHRIDDPRATEPTLNEFRTARAAALAAAVAIALAILSRVADLAAPSSAVQATLASSAEPVGSRQPAPCLHRVAWPEMRRGRWSSSVDTACAGHAVEG